MPTNNSESVKTIKNQIIFWFRFIRSALVECSRPRNMEICFQFDGEYIPQNAAIASCVARSFGFVDNKRCDRSRAIFETSISGMHVKRPYESLATHKTKVCSTGFLSFLSRLLFILFHTNFLSIFGRLWYFDSFLFAPRFSALSHILMHFYLFRSVRVIMRRKLQDFAVETSRTAEADRRRMATHKWQEVGAQGREREQEETSICDLGQWLTFWIAFYF